MVKERYKAEQDYEQRGADRLSKCLIRGPDLFRCPQLYVVLAIPVPSWLRRVFAFDLC